MNHKQTILVLLVAVSAFALRGQSPLVRQTLSAAGGTSYCTINSQSLMVQQSIGQLSVTGRWRGTQTEVRQGFIQPPVRGLISFSPQTLHVAAYPNPTRDVLIITFSEQPTTDVLLEVYDVSGRFIFQRNYPNEASVTCDFSNLALGCYMVKVQADGHVKTLQIQHL